MTREEAIALVREFIKNEGLVRHMLCVEAAMRFYAEKFGEDIEMILIGRSIRRSTNIPAKVRRSCASAASARISSRIF
jgi:hypothetical protein